MTETIYSYLCCVFICVFTTKQYVNSEYLYMRSPDFIGYLETTSIWMGMTNVVVLIIIYMYFNNKIRISTPKIADKWPPETMLRCWLWKMIKVQN